MGPSILFDKSAIQSLGQESLSEVSRYFCQLVPPVLLMETLADLSLEAHGIDEAKQKVRTIADKLWPIHSQANLHYHPLCVHNLLGEHIPMNRVPVIGGAKTVTAKDGSKGLFTDVQPENEAVLRWQSGQFSEADLTFAAQWREAATTIDFQAMMRQLPQPEFKLRSLEEVSTFVTLMLTEPEFREPVLRWFLGLLRCDQQTYDRVCFRWRLDIHRSLHTFAPYALHCLRVQLLYYIGMSHGILSTRSSNIVDLEYLCYTPFAFVFCSGDKLHGQLAPFILDADQSFVERQEMQESLKKMVAARRIEADSEPSEDSLIHRLWMKHWGKPPHRAVPRPISEEEGKKIMERMRPIIDALREQKRERGPRFPV